LPAEVRRAIVQIARTPRLLVACDYDGTLAPITLNPDEARPLPESVGALRSLAALHETTAVVISGRALRDLAALSLLPAEVHQVGATAANFLGDDVTDEKVFTRLSGPDVGIKVGDGETLAAFRVPDTVDVATVLAFLLEERRNWLYGQSATPIERLSMLANERSVALLTPDAKLTWLCHPGPDAPAVFADLLGGGGAGHFPIHPDRNGL